MNNPDIKHPVVTRSEWLAARRQLWLHEKPLLISVTKWQRPGGPCRGSKSNSLTASTGPMASWG